MTMTHTTTIHARIKRRREALGISLKALADLVGVSWQTVQQWEREEGGTAPKRERLATVAQALNTTPEELLFGFDGAAKTAETSAPAVADLSRDALEVARAFDKLKSNKERESVLALLRAFNVM
jgi:transcriptional regulator with XRE-family HTH domain